MQIKDENAKATKRKLPKKLKLKTELVYEDNSPAPLCPLCPLRDSQKKNPKYIFNKIFGEPSFSSVKNNAKTPFSFRIEEVSFHHSGHKGFKLNVYIENDDSSITIHQSPMEEVIAVLSKPKLIKGLPDPTTIDASKKKTKKKKRKRSSSFDLLDDVELEAVSNGITGELESEFLGIIPLDSEEEIMDEIKPKTHEEKDGHATIPVGALIDSYRCLGSCFCCNLAIETESFFNPNKHRTSCDFATKVLPFLTFLGVTSSDNDLSTSTECTAKDTHSKLQISPFPDFPQTAGTSSFEEKKISVEEKKIESTPIDVMKALPIATPVQRMMNLGNISPVPLAVEQKKTTTFPVDEEKQEQVSYFNSAGCNAFYADAIKEENVSPYPLMFTQSRVPINPTKQDNISPLPFGTAPNRSTVMKQENITPLPFSANINSISDLDFDLEILDFPGRDDDIQCSV